MLPGLVAFQLVIVFCYGINVWDAKWIKSWLFNSYFILPGFNGSFFASVKRSQELLFTHFVCLWFPYCLIIPHSSLRQWLVVFHYILVWFHWKIRTLSEDCAWKYRYCLQKIAVHATIAFRVLHYGNICRVTFCVWVNMSVITQD